SAAASRELVPPSVRHAPAARRADRDPGADRAHPLVALFRAVPRDPVVVWRARLLVLLELVGDQFHIRPKTRTSSLPIGRDAARCCDARAGDRLRTGPVGDPTPALER